MNLFENLQMMNKTIVTENNKSTILNSIQSTKEFISNNLKLINDQAFANVLREIIFQSNIKWKTVQLIISKHMPEVKIESLKEDIKNETLSEAADRIDDIKYIVTCQLATGSDDVYSEHYTLKDAIASARKAQQSFFNVKIKDLSDGLSWLDIDDAEQDLKNEEQKSH